MSNDQLNTAALVKAATSGTLVLSVLVVLSKLNIACLDALLCLGIVGTLMFIGAQYVRFSKKDGIINMNNNFAINGGTTAAVAAVIPAILSVALDVIGSSFGGFFSFTTSLICAPFSFLFLLVMAFFFGVFGAAFQDAISG